MEATRINALLAEHLFDQVVYTSTKGQVFQRAQDRTKGGKHWPRGRKLVDYCGTWEGMGQVVEAMAKRKRTLSLLIYDGLSASADFASPGCDRFSASGEADTAPMAVALAALSDLGVEV